MRTLIGSAALAATLLGGAGVAYAQDPQAPVQTNARLTVDQQLAAQQQQIQTQQEQIDALQDQLRDMSQMLANRVDRVEAQTENGRVNASAPGPRLEGPNARNSLAFVGAVQATFGTVDEDPESAAVAVLHGGTEIKRARIGLQGTAYSDYNYAVEFELAQLNGTVSAAARDLWVQYNGFRPLSFTIGNMKPQTGLEASFSDRSNAQTFIESSMMSSMITSPGTRYIGLRASTGGQHWSASLGAFGDDVNNNGVTTPNEEGFGVHGRFTWAPIATPTDVLHFGISGYDRDVGTTLVTASATTPADQGQLRPRAQAENSIDAARLIDTGNLNFSHHVTLGAVELAALHGPIGLQAEWAQMDVQQVLGRPDLTFSGGYVGVNWFLTGESRVYDPRTGVFTRFSPHQNLDPSSDSWGAFELAARWSTLDLNSEENTFHGTTFVGVRGGEETNTTLGLNWYWNPYFRMMLNWVHADVDRRGAPASVVNPLGSNLGATADLVALRVQQEW
ncbi:MAG: porin [Terricaulis sp.]